MENLSERIALFWLAAAGATAKKVNTLLAECTAIDIWNGVQGGAFTKVFGSKLSKALVDTQNVDSLLERLDFLRQLGVHVVTRADEEYPSRLAQPEVNPPIVLYCKGDVSLLKSTCVAVVGSRACSQYGKDATEMITRELVHGSVTVVAGLATGIDTYAHTEAVNSLGKTIAVLGGGFNNIYPVENWPLYKRILGTDGLVVCEHAPEFRPHQYSFPERNRIISGLSLGVVVVEATERSGALLTANLAAEQGREVFAVPGSILSSKSAGTNRLLQEGNAIFTMSARRIFDELRISAPKKQQNKTHIMLDGHQKTVYNLLKNDTLPFDELVTRSNLLPNELSSILTALEIKGLIRRLPANFFSSLM